MALSTEDLVSLAERYSQWNAPDSDVMNLFRSLITRSLSPQQLNAFRFMLFHNGWVVPADMPSAITLDRQVKSMLLKALYDYGLTVRRRRRANIYEYKVHPLVIVPKRNTQ